MGEKESFIAQTAKDYDMDFDIVGKIYVEYPETFYLELEEYIKNRSKKQGGQSWESEAQSQQD